MAEAHACPVCSAEAPLHDVVDFNRSCEDKPAALPPLSEGAFVYFSTFAHDRAIKAGQRIDWWYVAPRNGHVSIFSRYSLSLLGDRYGFRHGSFTDYLHCFCTVVPDWAQHLIQ